MKNAKKIGLMLTTSLMLCSSLTLFASDAKKVAEKSKGLEIAEKIAKTAIKVIESALNAAVRQPRALEIAQKNLCRRSNTLGGDLSFRSFDGMGGNSEKFSVLSFVTCYDQTNPKAFEQFASSKLIDEMKATFKIKKSGEEGLKQLVHKCQEWIDTERNEDEGVRQKLANLVINIIKGRHKMGQELPKEWLEVADLIDDLETLEDTHETKQISANIKAPVDADKKKIKKSFSDVSTDDEEIDEFNDNPDSKLQKQSHMKQSKSNSRRFIDDDEIHESNTKQNARQMSHNQGKKSPKQLHGQQPQSRSRMVMDEEEIHESNTKQNARQMGNNQERKLPKQSHEQQSHSNSRRFIDDAEIRGSNKNQTVQKANNKQEKKSPKQKNASSGQSHGKSVDPFEGLDASALISD